MSDAGTDSGTAGRQSLGTLGEVGSIIAGEPTRALAALAPDTAVRRVVTDTRAGIARGDLFVALQGPSFDGADFVERALADGAVAAIVARASSVDEGWPVWRVEDPLAALHVRLANHHQPVKPSGADQRGVDHIGAVGCTDDHHVLHLFEAVHLGQQLIHHPL